MPFTRTNPPLLHSFICHQRKQFLGFLANPFLAVRGFSTANFSPSDCASSYALLERPNAEWPVGATDRFAASTREKKTRKWRKMVEPWWDHELVSVPSTHGQRNITIALHRWRARHAVTLGGGRRPALVLWVHGGGMVLPSGRLGDPQIGILRRLGPQLLIAAVESLDAWGLPTRQSVSQSYTPPIVARRTGHTHTHAAHDWLGIRHEAHTRGAASPLLAGLAPDEHTIPYTPWLLHMTEVLAPPPCVCGEVSEKVHLP